jgi:hypothetical protein
MCINVQSNWVQHSLYSSTHREVIYMPFQLSLYSRAIATHSCLQNAWPQLDVIWMEMAWRSRESFHICFKLARVD